MPSSLSDIAWMVFREAPKFIVVRVTRQEGITVLVVLTEESTPHVKPTKGGAMYGGKDRGQENRTLFVETTRGGSGGLPHAWQRAETVRLHSKDRVEFAAEVFESDHRS